MALHILFLPDISSAPGAAGAAAATAGASPPVDSDRSAPKTSDRTMPCQSRGSHFHRSIKAKKG